MKCAKVGCFNGRSSATPGVLCDPCYHGEEPQKVRPHDMVNEPPHYRSVAAVELKSGKMIEAGELEAIDVLDAFNLDRYIANVVKYCLRAGRKGPALEDLKKARMLLDRKIHIEEFNE